MMEVLSGLLIPFAGTSLGAACVLFVRKEMNVRLQRALTGFAAGVMVAASVWSLLLPALSQASDKQLICKKRISEAEKNITIHIILSHHY